ncbi:MAG TPA: glycosyltransferase family 4 protein [Cytophagaceae bacterium]
MKIAIVINTSWNIYNFRMELVKTLLREGHEVVAIAPFDEYSEKLEASGCRYFRIEMQNKGSNPLKDLLLIKDLYRLYKKLRPDVILHYTIKPNIYGTLAAQRLGIPVINNVSGLGTVFLHNNLVSKIAILLYKVAFRFPKKVFFQNKDDLHLFVSRGIVKKEITGLLPGSGVNLEKFTVVSQPQNTNFTFLMIARLLYDKGVVEFAEAVRLLRNKGVNARFVLLGSLDKQSSLGIPEKVLNEWINEGLVEYKGFSDNIIPYIQMADCVVLPSYREGTPRTLLEAAACGKPLIATNVPGCIEVVQDGVNGFLCKVKDAADLSVKMEMMMNLSAEDRMAMGRAGRKLMEAKFDAKIVISEYLRSINSLTGTK